MLYEKQKIGSRRLIETPSLRSLAFIIQIITCYECVSSSTLCPSCVAACVCLWCQTRSTCNITYSIWTSVALRRALFSTTSMLLHVLYFIIEISLCMPQPNGSYNNINMDGFEMFCSRLNDNGGGGGGVGGVGGGRWCLSVYKYICERPKPIIHWVCC